MRLFGVGTITSFNVTTGATATFTNELFQASLTNTDTITLVGPITGTTGPTEVVRENRPAANSGGAVFEEVLTTSDAPHATSGAPDGTEASDHETSAE